MLIEIIAYLISSATNIFSILAGVGLLNVVVIFFSLIVVYNLFLYSVYRGIKSTLVPSAFITITLQHTLLKIFGSPDYLVDLALLVVLVVLLGTYWDYYGVRDVLNAALPASLLISALLSIWIGLTTPARYSLASIIEVIVYRLLREYYSLGTVLKYLLFLEFLTIYLNPALYVNVYVLTYNLLLFIAKAVINEKNRGMMSYVINLDVFLKPLAVRWFT